LKKVYLFNISGCSGISLDRARLEDYFAANDCEVVRTPGKADVVFVLTCGYDRVCEDLSMTAISSLKRYAAEIIVGGCLPEINAGRLARVHTGRSIPPKRLEEIDAFFPGFKVRFNDVPEPHRLSQPSVSEKARVYFSFSGFFFRNVLLKLANSLRGCRAVSKAPCLRIGRGCLGDCSYCAIKKAVGALKSKPAEGIVAEARGLLAEGHSHLQFIADDVGAYGLDIGETLPALLDRIVSLRQDIRLDLPYIHPQWLLRYKEELLDLVRRGNIRSLLCAIQSASSRVLRLMNRDSDLSELGEVFVRLKRADARLKIATEAIAGFPSETEDEFRETVDFIKRVRFDSVSFFSCHVKQGTPAEKISPKIADTEVQRRIHLAIKELRKQKILAHQATFPPWEVRKTQA